MDINHILTVLTAPDDCKDLIHALACELDTQRKLHVTMAREIERKDASYAELANNAHTLRVERDAALERLTALEGAIKRQVKAEPPEPGSSLDDLLRYAAASQTEVRVTFAAPCEDRHNGTLEGVPEFESNGPEDKQPWRIDDWYCGTTGRHPADRIVAVELL